MIYRKLKINLRLDFYDSKLLNDQGWERTISPANHLAKAVKKTSGVIKSYSRILEPNEPTK